MALINCKECGKEISDNASSCPNCGCPKEGQKIGIDIMRNPRAITRNICNIYKVKGNNNIKIASCKEEKSIYIECNENMTLLFEFNLKTIKYNVSPRKKL